MYMTCCSIPYCTPLAGRSASSCGIGGTQFGLKYSEACMYVCEKCCGGQYQIYSTQRHHEEESDRVGHSTGHACIHLVFVLHAHTDRLTASREQIERYSLDAHATIFYRIYVRHWNRLNSTLLRDSGEMKNGRRP